MSSAPVLIDPVANFLNTLINGLTTKVAAPALEAALESQAPFLAAPVVKQLFEAAIGYLAGKISVVEQDGIIQLVFNIEQSDALYNLSQSLIALQNAQKSGDQNAISQATQDAANKWASIIHFSGVSPVQS